MTKGGNMYKINIYFSKWLLDNSNLMLCSGVSSEGLGQISKPDSSRNQRKNHKKY